MVTSPIADEVHHPDGRVTLASNDEIANSGYANGDLAPLPLARRTWTTYNYAALWVGISHNIPTSLLASGTIAAATPIVLAPMLLNSHAGTKYGIPCPVFARASFGLRGANLPAILRALVACGWFGIQSWLGGQAIAAMLAVLWPATAHMPAVLWA